MTAPTRDATALLRTIASTSDRPADDVRGAGLVERIPELADLAGVAQDAVWHPEGDVLTHSLLAMDAAASAWRSARRPDIRREVVVLAALLHDIGKPATTRLIDGRLTSRGHAEHGADLVAVLAKRAGWPASLFRPVAAIVRTHMVTTSVTGEPSRRAVRRLEQRLLEHGATLEEWAVVVDADGQARAGAAIAGRSAPWMEAATRGR
ncbi:HD domain-containing protein [uncultured Microbacterium sp.]|uniref:HD domain-containing protein n=1 Tax=uncultured Microbacterium sp. TaxID=191216 RepID=UPI0025DE593D|nr:HD domain-containing protein [uncultured Microbacterium sp.]